MPFLAKSYFNLKYRCYRPQAYPAAAALMQSQYWSVEQWSRSDNDKRAALVRHAFQKIPFYRKLYSEAGFSLNDIGAPGYFERLPVLTKELVRSNFDAMTDPALLRYTGISTTGGSTGVPLKVRCDLRLPYEALTWRLLSWWGLNIWDSGAFIWRIRRTGRLSRLINEALWWPKRKLALDASSMTDETVRKFLKQFCAVHPPLLQGYVGALTELAQYVVDHKIEVPSPKMIWATSAPLSEVQRHLLVAAFHAPVCDQYGSCEIPSIAAQCPVCKGLHVNAEHVYLEFVDGGENVCPRGEWGTTLVTNYDDFAFPLIRYENGDSGRWLKESCSCGRTLPLIDSVKGRVSETVTLPSGRKISGEFLTTLFDDYPDAVRAFRVIQRKSGKVSVEYVPALEDVSSVIRGVHARLESAVANEVPVEVERVQAIGHDGGKLRFVVREV